MSLMEGYESKVVVRQWMRVVRRRLVEGVVIELLLVMWIVGEVRVVLDCV